MRSLFVLVVLSTLVVSTHARANCSSTIERYNALVNQLRNSDSGTKDPQQMCAETKAQLKTIQRMIDVRQSVSGCSFTGGSSVAKLQITLDGATASSREICKLADQVTRDKKQGEQCGAPPLGGSCGCGEYIAPPRHCQFELVPLEQKCRNSINDGGDRDTCIAEINTARQTCENVNVAWQKQCYAWMSCACK